MERNPSSKSKQSTKCIDGERNPSESDHIYREFPCKPCGKKKDRGIGTHKKAAGIPAFMHLNRAAAGTKTKRERKPEGIVIVYILIMISGSLMPNV
jgi:hypothetical protein